MIHPDHFLYAPVNRFLLRTPVMLLVYILKFTLCHVSIHQLLLLLLLQDVPMFNILFLSSGENFKKDRVWMLRYLAHSLQTSLVCHFAFARTK